MLIQPLQSGAALLDDIDATTLEYGQAAVWWLGQSGYAIKTASILFYVDLYLSEHLTAKYADTEKPHIRMTESPVRGADLRDVRWVFGSHKHSDHIDPGTLPDVFAHSPDARLVAPLAIADHVAGLGLPRERLLTTRGDERFQVGSMTVHSLPSAHPDLDYTEAGGYPFLGFVFEVDGVTLYHSGDTLVYEGLADRLRRFDIDIAFLPVNGTDERRRQLHVPPNMNAEEAVALAREIGARLVIPHHYDMFTFNTVDIHEFERLADAAGQPYKVVQAGEKFVYSR